MIQQNKEVLGPLLETAAGRSFPNESIEAAKAILVHDLAVALRAGALIRALESSGELEAGRSTDLLTGVQTDPSTAVSRNGQLIHRHTLDDTLLAAGTHVGAASIPVLLALGEMEEVPLVMLLRGLAGAFAAAEQIGAPILAAISSKGIRPTPLIGPPAAVVGIACMLEWDEDRTQSAISKAAAVAFGTSQAWIEGSQEWLFHVSAAGLLALHAARSTLSPGQPASDPFWGEAGVFTALGLHTDDLTLYEHQETSFAATRARLKRFPICACNQVPLALLESILEAPYESIRSITAEMPIAEATYPGIDRNEGVETWSSRVMSLPYSLAVMVSESDFTIGDLQAQPANVTEDDIKRIQVKSDPSLSLGNYRLLVRFEGGSTRRLEGTSASVLLPERAELQRAATSAMGTDFVTGCLSLLDEHATTVPDLLSFIREKIRAD